MAANNPSGAGIKTLFLATRPQFLPAIVIPVALGASTAWDTLGVFKPGYFILCVVAALFYHAGMNVLNDYFDYFIGSDNINKKALTPFTGGSRFIQNGLLTPRQTGILGAVLIAAGSIIGIYLALKTTWLLFVIGLIGLVSGVCYSAPPLFLAGRGLGEITVGLNFGLLTVLGSFVVQTGTITLSAVFASLPVSFLIAALLYINEFPDYEADRDSGKRTLVVRLGPEKARYYLIAFLSGAYLSIIIGAVLGYLPTLSLIALLSLVFALPAAKGTIKNYRGGIELVPSIKSIILTHLSCGVLLVASNLV